MPRREMLGESPSRSAAQADLLEKHPLHPNRGNGRRVGSDDGQVSRTTARLDLSLWGHVRRRSEAKAHQQSKKSKCLEKRHQQRPLWHRVCCELSTNRRQKNTVRTAPYLSPVAWAEQYPSKGLTTESGETGTHYHQTNSDEPAQKRNQKSPYTFPRRGISTMRPLETVAPHHMSAFSGPRLRRQQQAVSHPGANDSALLMP